MKFSRSTTVILPSTCREDFITARRNSPRFPPLLRPPAPFEPPLARRRRRLRRIIWTCNLNQPCERVTSLVLVISRATYFLRTRNVASSRCPRSRHPRRLGKGRVHSRVGLNTRSRAVSPLSFFTVPAESRWRRVGAERRREEKEEAN